MKPGVSSEGASAALPSRGHDRMDRHRRLRPASHASASRPMMGSRPGPSRMPAAPLRGRALPGRLLWPWPAFPSEAEGIWIPDPLDANEVVILFWKASRLSSVESRSFGLATLPQDVTRAPRETRTLARPSGRTSPS